MLGTVIVLSVRWNANRKREDTGHVVAIRLRYLDFLGLQVSAPVINGEKGHMHDKDNLRTSS